MYYTFPCGCKFKQFDSTIKEDGLPPIEIDFYNLPDCPLVWDMLGKGYSKGVFQLEKGLGKKWVKELKPSRLEDLSSLAAIIRPGVLESKVNGKSLTQKFVDRKNHIEEATPLHPSLAHILKDTEQIIIFQEQIIKIANEIAGFTVGEADILRKGVGSKDSKIIQSLKTPFIDGCKKVGKVDEKFAEELFEIIANSSRYSFNACLCPSTVVETKNGLKILKDVEIGDYIDSPYGFIKVIDKMDNGVKDVYEIFLESGKSIKCTLDHKFLCNNRDIKPISYIIENKNKIITKNGDETVIKYNRLGLQPTMDITVDHPSHIFYGNDIATSNSHSQSYGILGYATAYAKVHFPTLFFTSYLEHADDKIDKKEEIRELIDDMKTFSVNIAPPKLTNSIIDNYGRFWVIDENIQFGLSSIKGFGPSHIKKLYDAVKEKIQKIKKNVKDFTWIEFLCEIAPLSSSTIINNLILCGASPDTTVSRKRKVFEYKLYSSLSDREQKWINNNYSISLLETLKKYSEIDRKNGGPANINRKQAILDTIITLENPAYNLQDSPEWIVENERELLGISISYNIMDTKNIHSNYTCSDFHLGKEGNIIIGCEVTSVNETVVKNGASKGQKMAFVTIKDGSGSVSGIIFAESYKEYRPMLYSGNTIICYGIRSKKNPKDFIINKVTQI